MDKRQFSTIISKVYKPLSPSKVSVFIKNEHSAVIRVVAQSFTGMTFSARFKLLNDELLKQQPELFNQRVYIFEAFTSAEVDEINLSEDATNSEPSDDRYRESTKEI